MKIVSTINQFDKYGFDVKSLINWINRNHKDEDFELSSKGNNPCLLDNSLCYPRKRGYGVVICRITTPNHDCDGCIFEKSNIKDAEKIIKYIKNNR